MSRSSVEHHPAPWIDLCQPGVSAVAPRANWKGFLKIAELTCQVSLYTAASTSERIAFHTLNRETGHRVRRQFVDQESGKLVDAEDQVKGYEVGQGEYVVLEPDEIAAAVPESDKTLNVEAFIACSKIDGVYFDRPYYLAPSNPVAQEAFAIVREGMRAKKVAALARTVLFRRVRTLLVRAHGAGLIANTLNFDYEVKSAEEAFSTIPEIRIQGEMLDLAKHIIKTKRGKFDPSQFDDRYEAALAELVRAKLEGRPVKIRKPRPPAKVVNLMEALRQSAAQTDARTERKSARQARPASGKTATAKATVKKATSKKPQTTARGSRTRKAS
jgi:DNA end-binding protein Ku